MLIYLFALDGTGAGISMLAWAGTFSLNSQDCCLSFQAKKKLREELWNFSIPQSCSVAFFHHFKEVLNSIYSKGAILWGTEMLLGARCKFSMWVFFFTLTPWARLGDLHAQLCPQPSPHPSLKSPNSHWTTQQILYIIELWLLRKVLLQNLDLTGDEISVFCAICLLDSTFLCQGMKMKSEKGLLEPKELKYNQAA